MPLSGSAEGLGLGAGVGLGTAMAGMVAQTMSNAQQTGQQTPQPAAAGTPASGVMTLEEAAAYLKVTPADVQAMIDSGDLKAKKIGAQVRISKEAIDTFLAS
jgi:excisionase family DNA binding protein